MKKLVALVLVAVMGLSMVGCGKKDSSNDSKSDLEYVKEKGTLVVGVTDFAPMDYKDDSGNWIGFDADMASNPIQLPESSLNLMQTWHPHLLRASA